MQPLFQAAFSRNPVRIEGGIYCFGRERDGDWFDETDVTAWQGGVFQDHWHSDALLRNPATRKLAEKIVQDANPVIDLACGPGMGMIPSIKQLAPDFPCLASDANWLVLTEWQRYLFENEQAPNLDFAQFSLMDIPLRDCSVQAFSSFIGLSSTRSEETGYALALAEVYRTLQPGGRLYCVENEWEDAPGIAALFERAGMQPWTIFQQPQRTWHDRFEAAGFRIISEEVYRRRNLRADDNDLGMLAQRFGAEVGLIFTAFIVEKA